MWYVIWTATGKEDAVRLEIVKAVPKDCYDRCFIIKKQEYRKCNGQWRTVDRILFPGYLFIETDKVKEFYFYLKKLPGFAKILCTGQYLTPVSREEEKWMKRLVLEGENVAVSTGIIENQTVHIKSGPLQGMEGLIRRIDRHKRRAWLHTKMFGREMDICVGLEVIEKIK